MSTNFKTTIWALALLFSVAGVLVLSSCGSDDPEPEPPIEIVPPGDFTYAATTVAVGTAGSVDPSTVDGTEPTFEITKISDGEDNELEGIAFFSVDAATGKISVAAESTTGLYKVEVTASNSKGDGTGVAEITIGINDDFNPTGKGYEWMYFMNQDEPWTLEGLDGEIAELPFPSVEIPTGWPPDWPEGNAEWNDEYLLPYLVLTSIQELIFELPGDLACGVLEPAEKGNTLYFAVDEDLTLTTLCQVTDENDGSSVVIGSSAISWAEDTWTWTLNLNSQIPVSYAIKITGSETFADPLKPGEDGMTPPKIYPALRGVVDEFLTPTNVENEAAILTSLTPKKVEVILEVIDL